MQVLGNQDYSPLSQIHLQHHTIPQHPLASQIKSIQITNNFLSQKKKPMNNKTKPNLPCDSHFEDFKENNPKSKHSLQINQSKYPTSQGHYQMTPFSSVLNIKPKLKINQPPKPISKPHQSELIKQQKNDEQQRQPNEVTKKYIEKMIETKLNHMIENKRKSASFKVPPGPKQNIGRSQKRKQSYHVQESMRQNKDYHQNIEKKQNQHLPENKHKGSLSFIIRKKISSNATESQRNWQKVGKQESGKSFEKEELIKSQNSKYGHNANSYNANNTQQNSTLTKYAYRPMQEQLKRLRDRHPENKQTSLKAHPIRGMKILKVRVNKVLRAQQQLFNEKCFPQGKTQNSANQKKLTQQHQQPLQKKQAQYLESNTLNQQVAQELGERMITIEQILCNQMTKDPIQLQPQLDHHQQDPIHQCNLIHTPQSKRNKQIIQPQTSLNDHQQSKEQAKWKSYKQTSNGPITTNRKRISSIRAIKNYYKKLDTQHNTQEKSSFMTSEKESKQVTIIKKKQKDSAVCLTHKIKWGNSSKKKLNSDRISSDPFNFSPQFSIDHHRDQIKQQKINQKYKIHGNQHPSIKVPIEAKQFTSPKPKKHSNNVQFLQEKFLKIRDQKSTKAERNLQRVFAQTIKSKELLDWEPIPFHAGSKSLIMFQDPGISMIINNNNSIHSPTYPIGLDGQNFQGVNNTDIHEVSPVAMIKKKVYEMIEEKCEEEHNPFESLQELYFELKSHKDINPKQKDKEIRVESLEELCQG